MIQVDDYSIPNAIEKLTLAIKSRPSGAFPHNVVIAEMIRAGMVDLSEVLRCPRCNEFYLAGDALGRFDEHDNPLEPGACYGCLKPLEWVVERDGE